MKNITIIIPITELKTDEEKQLFSNAYKSVPSQYKVLVVGDKAALESIKDINVSNNIETVENDGPTTMQNQINLAVSNVDTEYFSVLSYDDAFSDIWFTNFEKYCADLGEDVTAYLPLTEVLDYSKQDGEKIVGYANEAFWASSFSEEIGYVDINSLQDYLNINTYGGIFNTKIFNDVGKLKPSMKVLFWYEFLLRLMHKGNKVYVIPKVGYTHTINRGVEQSEMTSDEFEWWIDLANKEYFFTKDRNKTYKGV